MSEATAASAADETTESSPASPQADDSVRAFHVPAALAVGWLLFGVGLAWFILAGSVRVGAGHWLGQRLRVRVIWSRFLDFLADHGSNSLTTGLVAVAAGATLLGSLALLWWVLGQRNTTPEPSVTPDVS